LGVRSKRSELADDALVRESFREALYAQVPGATLGHEKEISMLAWEAVADGILSAETPDPKKMAKGFLEALSRVSEAEFEYVAPNYAVGFRNQGDRIVIGPVEALLSDGLIAEVLAKKTNPRWTLSRADKIGFEASGSGYEFKLPATVWRVRVHAAKGHVEEEALWLINVALGLLRLSYLSGNYDFFPSVGDVETSPLEEARTGDRGFVITEKGMSGGSLKMPNLYIVDEALIEISKTQKFQARTKAVFYPGKDTLGESFGTGLGWLTRGRQCTDRAERFLYFFTAVEALLSSNDKTAPIVQTICRSAAVVLQTDPSQRADVAKSLAKLYETRSGLVHRGKRLVSQLAVNELQNLAEHLFKAVLELTDLTQKAEEFRRTLAEASWGLPWPLNQPDTDQTDSDAGADA
jgi:hypothetical protein